MKTSTQVIKVERIILALLEYPTQEQAAAALGISTTTIRRALKRPEFQRHYRAARFQAFGYANGRFSQAGPAAVAKLLQASRNQKASPASRLRASRCLAKHTFEGAQIEDQSARISALKNQKGSSSCSPRAARPASTAAGGDAPSEITAASFKTQRIIRALMDTGSYQQAAAAAGMSVSTVSRWLQRPEFQAEYRKARRANYSATIARMQQIYNTVVSTILSLMIDKDIPASVQIGAADLVLQFKSAWMRDDQQADLDELLEKRAA